MTQEHYGTWIDIDLDALKQNYHTACSLTRATVFAVLKSNAYGHGLLRVAQALQEEGCTHFSVSCGREAILLRKKGVQGDILVMGTPEAQLLPRLIAEDVILSVDQADELTACENAAAEQGLVARVHLKLDTGFHRLGFDCTEENADILGALIPTLPHVRIEGAYCHLGLVDLAHDERQHEAFEWMLNALRSRGIAISCAHMGDSIGLVRYPDWHYDAVRVGALLYGVRPGRTEHMPFRDPETLAFRTTICQIRDVAAGEVIGYGDQQIFDHPVRVATLCAGYGDGYPRRLSYGKGQVLIHGKRCGVIGLICMDKMMVDITGVPEAQVGDTVSLLGGGIPYMDFADMAGTNRNEPLASLSARPLRIYHEKGNVVTVVDELLQERTDF